MAGVIVISPERWKRQPAGPVMVDINHPICAGMAFAWIASLPTSNLMSPVFGTVGATASRTVRDAGYVITPVAAGVAGVSFAYAPISTSDGAGTGTMTVAIFANLLREATVARVAAQGATNNEIFMYANTTEAFGASAGRVAFGGQTSSGVGAISASDTTAIDGKFHLYTGRRPASGAYDIWQDKRQLRLRTALTNHDVYSDPTQVTYCAGGSANVRAHPVAMDLRWNRSISEGEIQALAENPWQVFAAVKRRIYVIPDAAAPTFKPAWAMGATTMIGAGIAA